MVIGGSQRLSARITGQIRELTHQQGMSGRELARQLGVSHTWLQNRYSDLVPYTLDDLGRIADVLGVEVEELVGVGVYAEPAFLPPEVQRAVDQFATDVMARYERQDITDRQRSALLRIVREAWKYVEKGMTYWERELTRVVPVDIVPPAPAKKAAPSKQRESGGSRARR